MPEQESMLQKRVNQMHEFKTLPDFEKLYFLIGHDLGVLNDELIELLPRIQAKKKEIKANGCKSIAEFDREFELTEEFLAMKSHKYARDGLEKMMSGIRVLVESLKAEKQGQY